jgi:tryptophan synthase alpha subunit
MHPGLPIAVGIGISSADQVRAAWEAADAGTGDRP